MAMDSFDFELKPAIREAVPPLICFWAYSGGGKTRSALEFARGYVGEKGLIAVMDTENKRALMHSAVCQPWKHLDFQPPFSAERYNGAFKFCEKQNADITIVDSGSHLWEGIGGILDQADSSDNKGLSKWKKPKISYKRLMNHLTRSPSPLVFNLRAKESIREVGGKIVKEGFIPIMEKNFIFEMTLALHLTVDGFINTKPWNALKPWEGGSKIPGDLRDVFPDGVQVNQEMGRKVAEWVNSGAAVDPELLILKRDGADASMQGTEKYTAWGKSLTPQKRAKVEHLLKGWTADAKLADEALKESDEPPIQDIGI